jgi:hypothetical protein
MNATFRILYLKRLALGSALVMALAAVMTLLGTFKDAIWGPWYWLFAMRGLPQYFESRPFLSPICLAICLALACLSRATLILFMAWLVINHLGMIWLFLVGGRG